MSTEQFITKPDMKISVKQTFGFDSETGGRVFQLHLSNSPAMIESSFIHETKGDWVQGDIYFGFNISRVFTIKENK